ncbi:MAG: hypothetical protein LBM06_01255 [Prevotellaceae bacterium]|jgi:hypothetical protein|nr:hypothetical protein [Prevotellaceae bacterium]
MRMNSKTKIVLDSDVVIHFIKGNCFSLLLDIFPEYQYLILDVVYAELAKSTQTKTLIDNVSHHMASKLLRVDFNPSGSMMKEYALLLKTFGKGESACMVYCKSNRDVLGSSNLKDIKAYCESNGITYLTTIDFLYYAYLRKKMSKQECDAFIQEVIAKGSKLPMIDISHYACSVII